MAQFKINNSKANQMDGEGERWRRTLVPRTLTKWQRGNPPIHFTFTLLRVKWPNVK